MDSYDAMVYKIAKDNQVTEPHKFAQFISRRFSNELDKKHLMEWVRSFNNGTQALYMDYQSLKIYKSIY